MLPCAQVNLQRCAIVGTALGSTRILLAPTAFASDITSAHCVAIGQLNWSLSQSSIVTSWFRWALYTGPFLLRHYFCLLVHLDERTRAPNACNGFSAAAAAPSEVPLNVCKSNSYSPVRFEIGRKVYSLNIQY